MNILQDEDPMPYGKYKGTPMADVPTDYLHWLWENGVKGDKTGQMHDYIKRSMSALKEEAPDKIWSET
jgi:uncharacterized protein (DUF3820 family)